MKKKQWYKPWYIWLGPLVVLILFHLSLHAIDKYETKLKIGYPSQRALRRKAWRDFFFFCVVVMGLPTMAVGLLVEWLFGTTENFFLEHLYLVYAYPASVYVNYRYALWYEKNVLPLLEGKSDSAL